MTFTLLSICWLLAALGAALSLGGAGVARGKRVGGLGVVVLLSAVALPVATSVWSLWGLEYEDAFEYEYSSRFLAVDEQLRGSSLNPVCDLGSLRDCDISSSLAHPTGVAVLGAWGVRAVPEGMRVLPVLAVLAQLGAALGCWRLALWWGLSVPASAIAAATCCSLPVVLALGGSGFSEPIGGFVLVQILVVRESLLRETMGVEPAEKRGRLGWLRVFGLALGLLAASALAPVVRRELAAVVVVPLVALAIFGVGQVFRNARCGFSVVLPEFLILAGVALSVWLVGKGYASQEVLGLAEPFSVKNWLQLFPRFVWHLFDWRMYGPFGACLVAVLFFPRRARAIGPVLMLYAVFVTAFTGFSQSYYFVVAGEDPGFHFLRYSLEVAPLMALICGAAADGIGAWAVTFSAAGAVAARRVATGGVAVILASTIAFGGTARRRFSEEEEALRLRPVKRALAMLPPGATLISGWSVLVSLLGGDGQRVVAFESIGNGVSGDRLRVEVEDEDVFHFTETTLRTVERHRYRKAHSVLNEFEFTDCRLFVSDGTEYSVCRVLPGPPVPRLSE